MFEKEAEEYRKRISEGRTVEKGSFTELALKGAVVGYECGAEFGYNKANEWHKCSERPRKKINALCFDIKQNKFILGFYDLDADEWLRYGEYETINVDLWKEIVPPELKESEK